MCRLEDEINAAFQLPKDDCQIEVVLHRTIDTCPARSECERLLELLKGTKKKEGNTK